MRVYLFAVGDFGCGVTIGFGASSMLTSSTTNTSAEKGLMSGPAWFEP